MKFVLKDLRLNLRFVIEVLNGLIEVRTRLVLVLKELLLGRGKEKAFEMVRWGEI